MARSAFSFLTSVCKATDLAIPELEFSKQTSGERPLRFFAHLENIQNGVQLNAVYCFTLGGQTEGLKLVFEAKARNL